MTADYKAMRAAAKLPERTVHVCFRGDLIAELEDIDAELERLGEKTDSLDTGAGDLLERMEALKAEMRENTYPVRLRGMTHPKYNALIARHPARRDDEGKILEEDRGLGVNVETFWPALIRASIIDPPLPTDADWDEFDDGLTDFQYSELGNAAFALNRSRVDIPFSPAASRMSRNTGSE